MPVVRTKTVLLKFSSLTERKHCPIEITAHYEQDKDYSVEISVYSLSENTVLLKLQFIMSENKDCSVEISVHFLSENTVLLKLQFIMSVNKNCSVEISVHFLSEYKDCSIAVSVYYE